MAFDAFLRIDGPKKKKELQPLVIYKRVDKATPQLSLVTCAGGSIASARLDVVRVGDARQSFYQLLLQNVVIVGLEIEGVADAESNVPSEKLSLAYGAITTRYTVLGPDGKPQGTVEGSCFK